MCPPDSARRRNLSASDPVAALGIRLAFIWDYQATHPASHPERPSLPLRIRQHRLLARQRTRFRLALPRRYRPHRLDDAALSADPLRHHAPLRDLHISSWVAAVLMNICFSTLACVPVYYAGKRIGGTGLGAASRVALGRLSKRHPAQLPKPLGHLALGAARRHRVLGHAATRGSSSATATGPLYGLLWGVVLMTNAAVLSLLPPLLGWAAWRSDQQIATSANIGTGLRHGRSSLLRPVDDPQLPRVPRLHSAAIHARPAAVGWQQCRCASDLAGRAASHQRRRRRRDRYVQHGRDSPTWRRSRETRFATCSPIPRHEAELIARAFCHALVGRHAASASHDFIAQPLRLVPLCAALQSLRRRSARSPESWFCSGTAASMHFRWPSGRSCFPFAYYLTLALPRYRHPIDPTLMLLTAIAITRSARWCFFRAARVSKRFATTPGSKKTRAVPSTWRARPRLTQVGV